MQNVFKQRKIDRILILRYAMMALGILAFAPPVGFVAQLFGGTMLCGDLCGRMAIGLNLPQELLTRTAGVIFLFVWLGITFFFGRWMCSHVCPVGGLTEFAGRLVPSWLKLDYCKFLDAPLFRYGFLGAFILLPALGLASICCSYCSWSTVPETFGAIFVPRLRLALGTGAKIVSIGLYVGLLGVFSRDGRAHCHLVCPVGALDSLVNAFGAKLSFTRRIRIQDAQCSGCGQCVESCPASAIQMRRAGGLDEPQEKMVAAIDHHRCYNCRACERKCARHAIGIRKQKSQFKDRRTVRGAKDKSLTV